MVLVSAGSASDGREWHDEAYAAARTFPACTICDGTGLAPAHSYRATGLTPPTSALGHGSQFAPAHGRISTATATQTRLGAPRPTFAETGLTAGACSTMTGLTHPTSSGTESAHLLPHLYWDWEECCPVQIVPQMANASCMLLCTPNQGRPPVLCGLFPPRESHVRSSATIPPLLSASTGSRFGSPARAIPHCAYAISCRP
jgi:hypothetical protein